MLEYFVGTQRLYPPAIKVLIISPYKLAAIFTFSHFDNFTVFLKSVLNYKTGKKRNNTSRAF